MKPLKVASLTLIGILALAAFSAKAPPMVEGYLKLNIGLVIQQQALLGVNKNGDGKTFISTVDKFKVNNRALLEYMAEMFDTNWPAGAQLAYDLVSDQVVVTDSTGTNAIFYCEDGVSNAYRHAYVSLHWFADGGPYSGKSVSGLPGSGKFTGYWRATIDIHYENFSDSSVHTELAGDGLNIEKYADKITTSGGSTSRKETFTPFALGPFGNVEAILGGKITAKGKSQSLPPP
jgi:hypothetical protein